MAPDKKIDCYRTPLDPRLLRDLTARSDARGLLQSATAAPPRWK